MRSKFVLIFAIISGTVYGQFDQNMYDMNRNTGSFRLNPGMELEKESNYKWWIILPANININAHLTGFSLYDVFNKNQTALETISKLSSGRSSSDFLGGNINLSILEVGWKWENLKNKERWYFNVGIDFNGYAYGFFPQQLVEFLDKGYGYESFVDLSELKYEASLYTSYYFGMNYKKNNSPLTLGGKFKIYSSVLSIKGTNKSYFQTLPNGLSNLDIIIKNDLYHYSTSNILNGKIVSSDFLFSGNMGAGVDLGITYQKDNFKITASIIDLGFIYNSSETEISHYNYEGIYRGENLSLGTPSKKSVNDFIDEVEKNIKKKDSLNTKGSFFTFIPSVLHFGVTYTFLGNNVVERVLGSNCQNCDHISEVFTPKHNVGLQVTSIFRGRLPYTGVTLFYHSQNFKNFDYKITYTLEKYNLYNIGAVFSFRGLYISLENIIGYTNLFKSNAQSISIGYSLNFK